MENRFYVVISCRIQVVNGKSLVTLIKQNHTNTKLSRFDGLNRMHNDLNIVETQKHPISAVRVYISHVYLFVWNDQDHAVIGCQSESLQSLKLYT